MRFTTEDGRIWEKVCESKPGRIEGLPILYIAYDIQCELIIHVHEGHVHDAAMPEDRTIYKCVGFEESVFAIPTMDFETNFTPVPPASCERNASGGHDACANTED